MTEMIERCVQSVRATIEFGSFWDENDARAIVKAVILAMREPSERMVGAAHDRLADDGKLEDLYTAMIDAALDDQNVE